ncbi:CopM family metallochaperone [Sphingomonas sanguinis]|uniref:CopM family metallochaperone n=1 Tax=Sphingomonas sanguinis TaxID=33051 RepID=UPI00214C1B4F|nr:DUF305 domain-containing protein [Sphingomonas sanguinis]
MRITLKTTLAAAALLSGAALAQTNDFATAMAGAMQRMHQAMAVPSTGDFDRDFAAMMIPHHQGAIDMAEAELRFGKDERLRRLAQGIIVEQRQEISVMQAILKEKGRAPAAPQTHHSEGTHR